MKHLLLAALCLLCCEFSFSQTRVIEGDALKNLIVRSEKPYKLVYIFCDYCQASVERFPQVLKTLKENNDVELFAVCAQGSGEVASYVEENKITETIYMINQDRKKRLIDFYNPVQYTCGFMEELFGISAEKMGASDFCVLDKDNRVIVQTDYEMTDAVYFDKLKKIGK